MAGEADGEVVVPPTLQALLAARLDQLETAERSVLERGAIEGEIFHRGAVQALAPEETQVTPRLAALVRKELIRPDRPQLAGEDGFRFRHLLIRDAAYDALPEGDPRRAARALRRLAGAARRRARRAGRDPRLPPRAGLQLPRRARAARRRRAGRGGAAAPDGRRPARARSGQDYGAAVSLFERAAALVPAAELDLALEIELGDALFWAGRADEALRRADALAERAAAAGDRVGELCGRIQEGVFRLDLEPEGATESWPRSSSRRCPCSRPPATTWRCTSPTTALGEVADMRGADGRSAGGVRAGRRPRSDGRASRRARWRGARAVRFFGTTPVSELLAWLDENEPREARDHSSVPTGPGRWRCSVASTRRARSSPKHVRSWPSAAAESCSRTSPASSPSGSSSWPAIPPPQPSSARKGCRLLEELGDQGCLSTLPGASRRRSTRSTGSTRPTPGPAARRSSARATTCGRRCSGGRSGRRCSRDAASTRRRERLAREAVAIGDETEMLDEQGDAYADLAEVLLLAGKPDEAAAALEQALERYERKGNLVSAQRAQTRLAELRDAAPR